LIDRFCPNCFGSYSVAPTSSAFVEVFVFNCCLCPSKNP
jgi:hypothetical protein